MSQVLQQTQTTNTPILVELLTKACGLFALGTTMLSSLLNTGLRCNIPLNHSL